MTDRELQLLAERQLADYDAHAPGRAFADAGFSLTIDEAYALQLTVAQMRQDRGETLAGYKIGCVSTVIQREIGIDHPVIGHVWSGELWNSPAHLAAGQFANPAIEGEFAVRLARDIPDPEAIATNPAEFVESVLPVIELHNFVFRGPEPRAAELIANNAVHAGVVLGESGASPVARPLEISVRINGKLHGAATVNPLDTLLPLAQRLAAFGIHPSAGQLLLTGTPLPVFPVGQGDEIEVNSPGAGAVSARLSGAPE